MTITNTIVVIIIINNMQLYQTIFFSVYNLFKYIIIK